MYLRLDFLYLTVVLTHEYNSLLSCVLRSTHADYDTITKWTVVRSRWLIRAYL